ncbi:hypothetical protein C0995_016604 [Termitomyces sp. Mi166|nr:hypothetical protein C0995_016604 [Termitomyces sp. Mi166\
MTSFLSQCILCLVPISLVLVFHFYLQSRSTTQPGPSAYPLIGNLLDFPLKHTWKHVAKFAESGVIYRASFRGNNILILNSFESMFELLSRRGNIYSARPYFVVACELMDLIKCTAFLPFGRRWKLHRKLSRIAFNPEKVKQYEGTLLDIANRFVESLRHDPDAFAEHARLAAGRALLSTLYGIDAQSADDPYLKMAKNAMDMFPFMTSKRTGAKGRIAIADCVQKPFDHVKRAIENGLASPSFARDGLTEDDFSLEREKDESFESELKWASGTMFAAGQELISATIIKLILAMVINPDKLKLAQDELKLIVGARSPTVKDRDRLPFVHAIIKETLRWHISLPMSLVRSSIQDDTYRGHFIPKGTIIVPNVWIIAQDMNGKYDPDAFVPERFLGDNPAVNPSTYVFGFGKSAVLTAHRMCPGKLLAEQAIFLLTTTLLKTFNITSKVDENGKEIPIHVEFSSGLLS